LNIAKSTGDRRQERSYLWEARIALAIYRLAYEAQYEYEGGEGQKSIDFRLKCCPEVLIEALTIQNSESSAQAGRIKKTRGGSKFVLTFDSSNPDQRQTTGGEMVRLVELLTQKAKKFPAVRDGVYHLILADIRGYNAGIFDLDDCDQITFGPTAVHYDANRQFFRGNPVLGIFDLLNDRARRAQERIHGIGLFDGRNVGSPDVLATNVSIYRANSSLLKTQEERDLVANILDGNSTRP
jgi:hypothetical protein